VTDEKLDRLGFFPSLAVPELMQDLLMKVPADVLFQQLIDCAKVRPGLKS
jgi:hypothetical protein